MDREFHNKIYNEVKHLSTKVNHNTKLSQDELDTAINDSTLKLIKKFEAGIVPYNDYEAYKGYMFITITNSILSALGRKSKVAYYTKTVLFEDNIIFEDIPTYSEETTAIDGIQAIINNLSDTDKQIIQLRVDGLTQKEIAKELGMTKSAVNSRTFNLLKEIKAKL